MNMNSKKVAGTVLFVGGVQFVLAMILTEAVYPGYSISQNYISDLGVGPTAAIFNSSVFLAGAVVVASAYFLQRSFRNRIVTGLLVLAGLGVTGVGVFPENFLAMHTIVSGVAFIFGGLTLVAAYKVLRKPFSYFSVVMGLLSLSALVLLSAQQLFGVGEQFFLGLGPGGMERMIAYPVVLWEIGFGGYLIGAS